jgi:hypothetical protein
VLAFSRFILDDSAMLNPLHIFFLCFFLLQPVCFAQTASGVAAAPPQETLSVQRLAKDPAWLKIMHYRKGLFGFLSEISGKSFFFSAMGPSDPLLELQASVSAFTAAQKAMEKAKEKASLTADEAVLDKQIECLFPGRFAVLKQNLPEARAWRMPRCPRFEHFFGGINVSSATLVFSSYYLNNPSSAFGHTFVRLNKDAQGSEHHALLDYGVGFAATAGDVNPLSFAVGGLVGSFHGEFTNVPYYIKVQEYNDYESRDLWEYDLNLTKAEVELLVAHLWELAHTEIQYKYLSANCSSLLFTSLEAAAPRLNLVDKLPYWVIPSDTVRTLFEVPGLVTHYHFRPSKRTQFLARFQRLSAYDQSKVKALAKAENLSSSLESLTADDKTAVLDTYIDYFDFRNFKGLVRADPGITQKKQFLLTSRSQLPPSKDPKFEAPEPKSEVPQSGHGSSRANFGVLASRLGERSYLLGQKFALHDFLDRQQGYPRDSTIDFMEFQLRALTQANSIEDAQGSVRLDSAYLFAVKSFAPYEELIPNSSWKVRIGVERTWDESCAECLAVVTGSGVGITWDALEQHKLFATLLFSGDISGSQEFTRNYFKIRLGPELNLRWIFSPELIAQVNATYLHILFTEPQDAYRVAEELRWTLPSQAWAIGGGLAHLPRGDSEARIQAFYYY